MMIEIMTTHGMDAFYALCSWNGARRGGTQPEGVRVESRKVYWTEERINKKRAAWACLLLEAVAGYEDGNDEAESEESIETQEEPDDMALADD